jgi:hypothetical protein
MSTTAEKSRPAARRSRLELIDAGIAKDEATLEAARARFVELAASEDAAVREAKRANPTASPYSLGSPAQQARTEAEMLDRTIAGLEKGLLALRAERDAAAAEAAAASLAERTKSAKALTERELRREAGAAFGALVAKWSALAECLEEQSVLAAGADGLVRSVGLFDRAAVTAWQDAASFSVEPEPVDFESCSKKPSLRRRASDRTTTMLARSSNSTASAPRKGSRPSSDTSRRAFVSSRRPTPIFGERSARRMSAAPRFAGAKAPRPAGPRAVRRPSVPRDERPLLPRRARSTDYAPTPAEVAAEWVPRPPSPGRRQRRGARVSSEPNDEREELGEAERQRLKRVVRRLRGE